MDIKNKKHNNKGGVLLLLLIVIFVFSLVTPPIISWTVLTSKVIRTTGDKEQALQIAEAGINYYQWHLAHYPNDYQDGSLQPGPFVHDYTDFDTQEIIGYFSLVITPPVAGSTIVTIQSTAWTTKN